MMWDVVDVERRNYEEDVEDWNQILVEKGIDVESRETKAERVYLKGKEKEMTEEKGSILMPIGAKAKHDIDKVDNPTRWLEVESKKLEGAIVEYNNVAFEQDADVIMCFKMTPVEYAEATKEALDAIGSTDTEDQE
jgi:hypothetical protein